MIGGALSVPYYIVGGGCGSLLERFQATPGGAFERADEGAVGLDCCSRLMFE